MTPARFFGSASLSGTNPPTRRYLLRSHNVPRIVVGARSTAVKKADTFPRSLESLGPGTRWQWWVDGDTNKVNR